MGSKDTAVHQPPFLEFMPVSLFGAVMGLSGLCFAWRLADQSWHIGSLVASIIGWIAIGAFLLLAGLYTAKWLRYPASVAGEFGNPVSVAFFSTFIISLLLMPGILLPYVPVLAGAIWLLGDLLTLLFAWFVLNKWMSRQQLPESAMPVWVLPVTGALNVPIVGSSLTFAGAHEICLVFFGLGIVFITIIMTIIFSRLFFQPPIAVTVEPSLLILVAPFALIFNSYEGLTGVQDLAASAFFYFCLFLLLLFGSKVLLLPRSCPFQVSWWSVSFPLAVVSSAALRYARKQPDIVHWVLAVFLLALTTFVIFYLLIQTIWLIWSGRFGQPVGPARSASAAGTGK